MEMTIDRMVELLEIEHTCMLRGAHDDCDRNCADCDLVQDDGELHEMYTDVIALLKKQEPKLVNVSENAYGYKFYNCPSCKSDFEMKRYDEPYMLPRYCDRCGQRIKWG